MPYVNDIIEKLRLILIDLGIIKRDWQKIERFEESWKNRIQKMSEFIPKETKSILDVGCGKMHLKEIIDPEILYLGIDYVSRGKDSKSYDINKKEFPNQNFDVIFLSGFLEYVEDLNWLINKLHLYGKHIILSYCILESFSDMKMRKGNAWKNHLSEVELIKIISNPQFKLKNKIYSNGQTIIHLSKI